MTDLNKRRGSRFARRDATKTPRTPDSVKDLLAKALPNLARVKQQVTRHKDWRERLTLYLPKDLLSRISGVVEREATLVIFSESAVWCTRIKYVIAEIESRFREDFPEITKFEVRVLPRRE